MGALAHESRRCTGSIAYYSKERASGSDRGTKKSDALKRRIFDDHGAD